VPRSHRAHAHARARAATLSALLGALVALALTTTGTLATVPATASPSATVARSPVLVSNCPELELVGVRGSGTTSPLGTTVTDVINRVRQQMPDRGSAMSVKDLEYPAIAVAFDPDFPPGYPASVRKGVLALTKYIRTHVRSDCGPHTPLYLIGYSQGAQVVGDTYQGIGVTAPTAALTPVERAHIHGVVMIADPRFRGSQPGPINVGSFSTRRNGIQDVTATARPEVAKTTPWRSYCAGDDVICQYTSANLRLALRTCVVGSKVNCPHFLYETRLFPATLELPTQRAADYITRRWRGATALSTAQQTGRVNSPFSYSFDINRPTLLRTSSDAVATWNRAVNARVARHRKSLTDWYLAYCGPDDPPEFLCDDSSYLGLEWKGQVVGRNRYASIVMLSGYKASPGNVDQNDADSITFSLTDRKVIPLSQVLNVTAALPLVKATIRRYGLVVGGQLPWEATEKQPNDARAIDRGDLRDYTIERHGITFWFDKYQAEVGGPARPPSPSPGARSHPPSPGRGARCAPPPSRSPN
jgi:hypothetical protein